jgi:glycosyltransferase involved in cell wall biosynthesis
VVTATRLPDPDERAPLITVGVTCFNAADTIERAVGAALDQTWSNREILIVDDGSSDESEFVLRRLQEAHEEVRVIRHLTNRGVAAARNTLLTHARGAFIAFCDDDDESAIERLSRQVARIREYEASHPGAQVLCHCDRQVKTLNSASSSQRAFGIGRSNPEPSGSVVADYVLGLVRDDGLHTWGMLGSGTLMARTDVLRAAGGFDVRFRRCEELDLAVRAAQLGAHFISVDAPLITQYLTTTPDKGGRADLRYRLLLLRKHKRYLKERHAYAGAWCNMVAQHYRGRHWWWRLWYLAALVCFPWHVSRKRLARSSLLTRVLRRGSTRPYSLADS